MKKDCLLLKSDLTAQLLKKPDYHISTTECPFMMNNNRPEPLKAQQTASHLDQNNIDITL
ncbi:MAG: hypothetical protein JXA61_08725 [Bacteroidales bacterium]|nr:hypothetical protein [Bacteroidales bacterium]